MTSNPPQNPKVKIHISIPEENKHIELECNSTDLVKSLKQKIHEKDNACRIEDQTLMYNQQILEDIGKLEDYGIKWRDVLFLYKNWKGLGLKGESKVFELSNGSMPNFFKIGRT